MLEFRTALNTKNAISTKIIQQRVYCPDPGSTAAIAIPRQNNDGVSFFWIFLNSQQVR